MSALAAQTISVAADSRTYNVYVGRGLLAGIGSLVHETCSCTRAVVVSDSNVAPLYAQTVADSLEAASIPATTITFPAGEANKTLATLSDMLERIAQAQLTRDDCVVAVGGGVTGDMAGLAAALYLRGIDVVQVPTSLLAMVDSSVGGKTAVDLASGKNLVGSFFQPAFVVADIDTLETLPTELIQDGFAEVIKHGIIRDANLFVRLEKAGSVDAFSPDDLTEVVARNIEIKRDVVEQDEREGSIRQILNFGHTIGHAIEAASNFELSHGASVAAGMCCIGRASEALGWAEPGLARRIENCVSSFELPTDTNASTDELLTFMMHDKKRHDAGFNFVIARGIGDVYIERVSTDDARSILDAGCHAEQGA